ncbi:MAG: peptidoglycan-binding protein [Minisyncoccia bacterium]|jgi:hypothetical protein
MFPKYMERGSHGPIVQLVIVFLLGAGCGKGLVADGMYGDVAVANMQAWQRANGISDDGGCGPETRNCMKERWGFDLELASRYLLADAPTVFFQPEGGWIRWHPAEEYADPLQSSPTSPLE